jgi:hypothetical protein
MGGQVPTDPGMFGMYGRFRVIPGTDTVVSVYLPDQLVSAGTIPFDRAMPTGPIVGGVDPPLVVVPSPSVLEVRP